MNQPELCPYCGDTRLIFNRQPVRSYDEGDLFTCSGCGASGESTELIHTEAVDESVS